MVQRRRPGTAVDRLIVRANETLLALLVLAAVVVVANLAVRPAPPWQTGWYAFAVLVLWAMAGTLLAVTAIGHAGVNAAIAALGDGFDAALAPAPRLVAEALIAVSVLLVAPPIAIPGSTFQLSVGATTVLALTTVVHHAVDALLFAYSLLPSA